MKKIFISSIVFFFCFGYHIFCQEQSVDLVMQTGHTSEISTVAFSSNGELLATGGSDNRVILWDIHSQMELRSFSDGLNSIMSLAFSPDGKILACSSGYSGEQNYALFLWQTGTGKLIRRIGGFKSVLNKIVFSPDGSMIAISSGFGPSGGLGVFPGEGESDNAIRVYSVETGRAIWAFQGHTSAVTSLAFGTNGTALVSAGEDRTIRTWDVKSGLATGMFPVQRTGVKKIAFSRDGSVLASSSYNSVILWDFSTKKQVRTLSGNKQFIIDIVFSPDGELLATSSADQTVQFWNAKTWEQVCSSDFRPKVQTMSISVGEIGFSADSKILACASLKSVKLIDAKTGKEVRELCGQIIGVRDVAFSPDGFLLASANDDASIRLWSLKTMQLLKKLDCHGVQVNRIKFNSLGDRLACGGQNGILRVWDVNTGKELWEARKHAESSHGIFSRGVTDVEFDPNDKFIGSVGEDSTIIVTELETGKKVNTIYPGYEINALAISPDSRFFAAGKNNTISLWDVLTGKKVLNITGDFSSINCISFSNNGLFLACGSGSWSGESNCIYVWELSTGKLLLKGEKHSQGVTCLTFDAKDSLIMAGSSDNDLSVWSLQTGRCVQTLKGHKDKVTALALSRGGVILASCSLDKSIKMWNINSGKEVSTFLAIDSSGYVLSAADNFYLASRDALKEIGFRAGNRVFPFEQFDLKFNRPDIVLQRIGFAPPELIHSYYDAYLKRLRKMNFMESMFNDDFHLPEIAISTQNIPLSTNNKFIKFTIKADDSKYLLDRVNVFVNDVPVYGISGINLRTKKVSFYEQDFNLELSDGINKIQVSVLNDKGSESLKETFEINCTAQIRKPDLFVIATGASKYADSTYDLKYADKDAKNLAAEFESLKGKTYGDVKLLILANEKATRKNILAAKEFLNQSRVDDIAVLFYAGHGLVDSRMDYYLGTYDVNFSDPSQKGLAYDDLSNLLDGIPARKKLLLIDACFSGEIEKSGNQVVADLTSVMDGSEKAAIKCRSFSDKRGMKVKDARVDNASAWQQELFADLRRGTGAVVISSSGGDEYSFEGTDWNNGVFTYSLLEGMRFGKADQNNDGKIQVSELQKYVIERVKMLTKGGQNPTVRQENLTDDFLIY